MIYSESLQFYVEEHYSEILQTGEPLPIFVFLLENTLLLQICFIGSVCEMFTATNFINIVLCFL